MSPFHHAWRGHHKCRDVMHALLSCALAKFQDGILQHEQTLQHDFDMIWNIESFGIQSHAAPEQIACSYDPTCCILRCCLFMLLS